MEDAKACMKLARTSKQKSTNTKRVKPKKTRCFEWYSKKCSDAKFRLKNLARLLQKNPMIPISEVNIASLKKNTEKLCELPEIILRLRQLKRYNLKPTTLKNSGVF